MKEIVDEIQQTKRISLLLREDCSDGIRKWKRIKSIRSDEMVKKSKSIAEPDKLFEIEMELDETEITLTSMGVMTVSRTCCKLDDNFIVL
ncbi:uncharacterized protein [Rutidosis leptorrhynchoides]